MTLLRHRIDLISVVLVLVAAGVQFAAFLLRWPWFACIPIIVLMRWTQLVEHNHAHLPIFRSRALNEVLGWVMFLNGGAPLEAYRMFHVDNHHRYTNRAGDWTSPFAYEGARFPDRPVHVAYYVATYSVIAMCTVIATLLRRPRSHALRRFALSLVVVGAATALLIQHDAARFFGFYYATWCVTYFVAPLLNWRQHEGCSFEDAATSARTDLSPWCRTLGLNIGYHAAHHAKPALHWSELARYHEARLAAHTPDAYYRNRPGAHDPSASRASRDVRRSSRLRIR